LRDSASNAISALTKWPASSIAIALPGITRSRVDDTTGVSERWRAPYHGSFAVICRLGARKEQAGDEPAPPSRTRSRLRPLLGYLAGFRAGALRLAWSTTQDPAARGREVKTAEALVEKPAAFVPSHAFALHDLQAAGVIAVQ